MGDPQWPPDGGPLLPEAPDTDPTGWEEEESTVMVDSLSSGGFFGDRFRIGAPLGTGAMGRVVQAIDLTTGAEVALKLLHRERAKDAEALERFRREAAVLEAIGHPGIVRVVAMGAAPDGTPWLAMELLRGETLKQRLQRGPLEPHAIVPVLNTLCDALEAAHTRGVVHRDLKPENVLLTSSGEPHCKLVDFGLSRLTASKTLTRTGTILGTPRYMAPEQIRSASTADLRVDVFSVGVLLYEMLAARSPYPAEDLGQLLGCVLEGRTVPLAHVRPDLPPAVGACVARAMARDPAARFQTAGAIAEAYANALGVRSGRSRLHGSHDIAAGHAQDEGSSPLIDPFGAMAFAPPASQRAAPSSDERPVAAGLAGHPLLATMAPISTAGAPIAPPTLGGGAGGPMHAPAAHPALGDAAAGPTQHSGAPMAPTVAPGQHPAAATPASPPMRASWPGNADFTRPRASLPGPAPSAPAPPRAIPPPAPARRASLLWVVFVVAVVVVVIGAALAAIVLRAMMHGSVHLPGMTLTP